MCAYANTTGVHGRRRGCPRSQFIKQSVPHLVSRERRQIFVGGKYSRKEFPELPEETRRSGPLLQQKKFLLSWQPERLPLH